MPPRRTSGRQPARKQHEFRDKLVLNQWMISLFGLDPTQEYLVNDRPVRAFHRLTSAIKDMRQEGLDAANLHKFHHLLIADIIGQFPAQLTVDQLLRYEERIVSHTQRINEYRDPPITWKYFQWLSLLFTEIYLDRYFADRVGLLRNLNAYVGRFNAQWPDHIPVPAFTEDELNKVAFQNATGSGKTLIMHMNVLQFRYYAREAGRENDLSRVILLTPNESLSVQHLEDFHESRLSADPYAPGSLYSRADGLRHIDVIEITKLADQQGPNTEATRNLGDNNLLLVDEGHRGMSGKEEGAWLKRRSDLCAKGFTFEYSATFQQAVAASGDPVIENAYAKSVLFDYSYRYFYEDGFGKDYQILNLPESYAELQELYLTAALLKFYQQLRIYKDKGGTFSDFNIEKPLWVFVGSSVEKPTGTSDEKAVMSDVALILRFMANFLHDGDGARRRIGEILGGDGQSTGLLDDGGNDIFAGAFTYLAEAMQRGEDSAAIYRSIMALLFNNPGGGQLNLERVKGDSGEIILYAGATKTPFGLIYVGNAKGLADHLQDVADSEGIPIKVRDTDFATPMFSAVRESSSNVNLLIGSKKFVEGWDCWRVSSMGLMHVGRSEGSQIIQLFGRGVRLKGYNESLKRSGHVNAPQRPTFIEELETLSVFGIEADFMERFRNFLKEEGLPGNERKKVFTTPLNVTYDFGKRLLILRPKKKAADGRDYDFKRDGIVPTVGEIPQYLVQNRISSDWYTYVKAIFSKELDTAATKHEAVFTPMHLAFLDYDALYFALEQYKRERAWYNLNISKGGIRQVLADPSWYRLTIPENRLQAKTYANVRLWQQVATELLKKYIEHLYNYHRRAFLEPRLEYRELSRNDELLELLPTENEYELVVDGSEAQTITHIETIINDLQTHKDKLLKTGNLRAINFSHHLYAPIFHVTVGGKIKIMPVALNESEYKFIEDLYAYSSGAGQQQLTEQGIELYVLRNLSRGKGMGFFEANGFHPDFILWLLAADGHQYLTFVEPHGLRFEGPGSPKIKFATHIKAIQARLPRTDVTLNSYILSWTQRSELDWGWMPADFTANHVLFMLDDRTGYVGAMIAGILEAVGADGEIVETETA